MFKTILVALALMFQVEMGHVAYYADGVMEQVVAVRQAGWTAGDLPVNLPPVIGFVARPYCDEIGRIVWLLWDDGDLEGPFLVSDCADVISGDLKRMLKKGIVVEVDWNTVTRRGIEGLGPERNYAAVIGLADE
jgi:hypothetical protein